eukprot:COSAG02_NODE_6468_length_3553_cov_2.112044_7_plen_367_part_00
MREALIGVNTDRISAARPEAALDEESVDLRQPRTTLSWAEQTRIAQRYTPVFWLHPDDIYRPQEFRRYLKHCELWFHGPDAPELILERGEVSAAAMLKSRSATGAPASCGLNDDGRIRTDKRWHLKCDPRYHYGASTAELSRVPVYTFVRDTELDGEACHAITYVTFYPYNGPYKVGGMCCRMLAGGHEADVEHVTMLVSKERNILLAVWFNAHHADQGQLVPAAEVEMMDFPDGRSAPVVYVAQNGHGHYPHEGTIHRIFNAGNDRMERGDLWQPAATLLPEAWDLERQEQTDTTWLQYSGRLGTPQSAADWHHCSHEEQREPRWRVREVGGVPAGIATKKWWVYDQNEWRSSSWCHRMFCLWKF